MVGALTGVNPVPRTESKPHLKVVWFAALLGACGGSSGPPPPAKDFRITASPSSTLATIGSVTGPIQISISGQNGFSDSVNVTLSGIPTGVSSQPVSPFAIVAGQSQDVSLSLPAGLPVADFTLQISGTSGNLSHTAQTAVAVMAISTMDTGSMLELETQTATGLARIGLYKAWGGSITEASLNGTDYVNNDDPGRQVQVSLWDGDADYTTSWGYNPIEAGDHDFNGSPLLASSLTETSIYTKSQPLQWAPENFGGGPAPVLGDAYIEKWISVVPGYGSVFKVHYKVTHFGTDVHTEHGQEAPVVYVNPNVPNFVYYGGMAAWTNDSLTTYQPSGPCCTELHTPENWGAYVDSTNQGIAVYTPSQYPHSQVFNAGSTLQLTPMCPFGWDPGAVLEFDTYILLGSVNQMRAAIYALHAEPTGPSPLPAWGNLDTPVSGDTMTGSATVSGWAWGLSKVTDVSVFVDGTFIDHAMYGLPKPEIKDTYPDAPINIVFVYTLDTTKLSNGNHAVTVKATDANGKVATYPNAHVKISN